MSQARSKSGILPDRDRLKVLLADPALDALARSNLAEMPKPKPPSLDQHKKYKVLFKTLIPSSFRYQLVTVACIVLILFTGGLVYYRSIHTAKVLACRYTIPHSEILSTSHPSPAYEVHRVEGRAGGALSFPIEPDRAPEPPVETLAFIRQGGRIQRADALLQPQRRSASSTSFYIEQPVDALINQQALRWGDNYLLIVVGRPGSLPDSAERVEQALSGHDTRVPRWQQTWQLIHVLAHISKDGQ